MVGYFTLGSVGVYPIVKHWNGKHWEDIPNDYNNYVFLNAIDGVADIGLWIAGSALHHASIEEWNGVAWKWVTIPRVYGDDSGKDHFNGMDVHASNDIWVVGGAHGFPSNPLIQHWDGLTWNIETVPFSLDDHEYLNSIAALSDSKVWTVGTVQRAGLYHSLALYGTLPCNETAPIPDEPKRVTRNNAIFTSLPVELRWKRSDGAKFYHVRVEGARQPYDILLDRRVTRPRKSLKKLLPAVNKYYWFVSACNDYGCSPWRGRRFFYQPHNH